MILDDLSASARKRIEKEKEKLSYDGIRDLAEQKMADGYKNTAEKYSGAYPFEKALKSKNLSIIAEVKKASPSKGIIANDFPYLSIAEEYEDAGADAISCLTEPDYFKGSDKYLNEIAAKVKTPVLRKDFTVDPYMIYQAKLYGASAVLLIASILSDSQMKEYFGIADKLGISCLFEAHDEEEVKRVIAAGARIVGVNNRNLKDFTVDIENSIRLRKLVPPEIKFVSESGIKNPSDIIMLKENGTDAVLIGEMLMRSSKKKHLIKELKEI